MKNISRRAALSFALSLAASAVATADEPAPTGTVTGRVVDTDGKPVAGVSVKLVRHLDAKPWSVELTTVTTNAEGVYRFDAVPPATWELEWEKENATPLYKGRQAGFWVQKIATVVVVTSGTSVTVPDVTMRLWILFRLKVRLPGNLPAAKQTFFRVHAPVSGGHMNSPGFLETLQTDARGVCRYFADSQQEEEFMRFAHIPTGSFGFAFVQRETAKTETFTVRLVQPAIISGTVTTPTGDPLPQENVVALSVSATPTGELADVARIVHEARQQAEHNGSDASTNLTTVDLAVVTAQFLSHHSDCLLPVLVTPTDADPYPPIGYPSEHPNGALIGKYRVPETGKTYQISNHHLCKTDVKGRFQLFVFPGVRYNVQTSRQSNLADYRGDDPNAPPGSFTVTVHGGQEVKNAVLHSPEPPRKPETKAD